MNPRFVIKDFKCIYSMLIEVIFIDTDLDKDYQNFDFK